MTQLRHFVVYYDPRDYPSKYVVRGWSVTECSIVPDPEPIIVTDSLTAARNAVPMGLIMLPRFSNDSPAIVEVWM